MAAGRPQPALPEDLAVVQRLGSGAYGQVYLCQDTRATPEPTQVAVKWIQNFTENALSGKRIFREIRLLASLDHENLLKLVDLIPPDGPEFVDVYFSMPYMRLDLHKLIYSKMKLSENQSQAFVCQILRGLKYLHSAGVCHRDLKPQNLLVNKDCTLRIADFGLARGRVSEEEQLTDYVVTRGYRAPELLILPQGYFEAVDLWSVGCIHVELRAREPLFPGHDAIDMVKRIAACLGFDMERDLEWLPDHARSEADRMFRTLQLPGAPTKPLEERVPTANADCLDLMRKLLTFNPRNRISASDALSHTYLSHLQNPLGETTAPRVFDWEFDQFEATAAAIKERVYYEAAQLHPEILERDREALTAMGWPTALVAAA